MQIVSRGQTIFVRCNNQYVFLTHVLVVQQLHVHFDLIQLITLTAIKQLALLFLFWVFQYLLSHMRPVYFKYIQALIVISL